MTETPYLTPGLDEAGPGLMQRASAILPLVRPALRYVPKNPLFLIGAAALGVAGVMAWRNREKIAQTARPMLQNAAAKGAELKDQAMTRGAEMVQRLPFGKDNAAETPESAYH